MHLIQYYVNITFRGTGKPKNSLDLLSCDTHFIVMWPFLGLCHHFLTVPFAHSLPGMAMFLHTPATLVWVSYPCCLIPVVSSHPPCLLARLSSVLRTLQRGLWSLESFPQPPGWAALLCFPNSPLNILLFGHTAHWFLSRSETGPEPLISLRYACPILVNLYDIL